MSHPSSSKGAAERLQKLKEQIAEYDYQYYVLDKPTVSDAVYDGLFSELKAIEAQHPGLITPDSPTQRVRGTVNKGFSSVKHQTRMLSLNDVFDEAEVEAWAVRIAKLLPPKTDLQFFGDVKKDGLACAIIYQDGVYTQAVTRGDGFVGEDVTDNVRTITSVPLRLRDSAQSRHLLRGRTEVRGEIVMFSKDFAALNRTRAAAGQPLFANPRNTAAGTIRQLDSSLVAQRRLHFLAYDIQRQTVDDVPTHQLTYQYLTELGFAGTQYAKPLPSVKAIHSYVEHWAKQRDALPYGIDGLVVKVDDRQLYSQLGVVGKNPRGAIAYKFPAEQTTTRLKDIFISIGRTGAATPVALLEPVNVAGSTVQMATLHNEGEIHRKDIRIGDTVVVRKAGDVIPEIVEPMVALRNGSEKVFVMPKKCPECQTTLIKQKADEAVWRCPNVQCPSRVHNHIGHFASKGALDIEGLGEKNVLALMDAGLIQDIADIYTVTEEQLLTLDRFAEVSAAKLVAAIADKQKPPLAKFLFGLGIRHVGSQTAVDLANHFHSLDRLQQTTIEELEQVDGVGTVVAESIVAWFADPQNKALLAKFSKNQVQPQPVKRVGGPLAGKHFVITGTLKSMGRDQAADKIRGLGGTFQSSVGNETDYLVVGQNVGASKLAKAKKLGITQIDEAQLLKLLQN